MTWLDSRIALPNSSSSAMLHSSSNVGRSGGQYPWRLGRARSSTESIELSELRNPDYGFTANYCMKEMHPLSELHMYGTQKNEEENHSRCLWPSMVDLQDWVN